MWVRIPPVLLNDASAGHWRAKVAVNHPLRLCRFDSCPAHWKMERQIAARCDVGFAARLSISPTRVRFPSASLWPGVMLGLQLVSQISRRGFDSRPGRCMAKWWNWQTRDVQSVVPLGVGVQVSPWSLFDCRWAGAQPALMRPACPDRYRDLQLRVGQSSAGPHKPGPPGATPGPATAEYANWQIDEFEKLVILQVRLLPRSLTWSRGPRAKTPA